MTTKARLGSALTLASLLLASVTLAQAPPRVRQNINDPTFDLALYQRAIDILKARDPKNDSPTDPTYNSYAFFEALHNGPEGEHASICEHQNEIFITWHRALLYLFERALQESDPPATRKLMLPYWNWTDDSKFPAPFTDPSSTLSKDRRGQPVVRRPGGSGRTFTTAELRARIETSTTWRSWAGGECTVGCVNARRCKTGACSGAEPCASCKAKYGDFEQPFHNAMHLWIGGPMFDDATAAADPMFWSFHAYVDVIHTCWQKRWNQDKPGCPDCPFVGMPGWTPSRVATTEALGYTYDFAKTPCAAPELVAEPAMAMAHAMPGAEAAPPEPEYVPRSLRRLSTTEQSAAQPVTVDVTIPPAEFATAHIRLDGLEVFPDYNYTGNVYLYPAGTSLAPADAAFRRQYLVEQLAVWGTGGHENHDSATADAPHEVTVDVDATTELRFLAKTQPGAKWRIAIVLDPPQPQSTSTRPAASAAIARAITVDRISLVFDRDRMEDAHAGY